MSREKIWIVRAGDGVRLSDVLVRAGDDGSAIADGRVFVGKKRVIADQPVKIGDAIRIGAKVASPRIELLFDCDGIVAAQKPAGLPTVPDHAGAAHSLVALVEKQTGHVGLRITSRLDREVSGVVLFAANDAAEAKLRAARACGEYRRRYVALAIGVAAGERSGRWDAPIGRVKDPLLRGVNGADAKPAATRWRVVAEAGGVLMLAVDPETGRTHQIRVHAAHAGWPLLGDGAYGPGRLTLPNGRIIAASRIALHAARVDVGDVHAEAPIPAELRDLWKTAGGDNADWTAATTD